jgi:hypothetical protein
VAITFLSVSVRAEAAQILLRDREADFAAMLNALGPDRDLAIDTTIATKLIARKRPRLHPIWDRVVTAVTGTGKRQWEPVRVASARTIVVCTTAYCGYDRRPGYRPRSARFASLTSSVGGKARTSTGDVAGRACTDSPRGRRSGVGRQTPETGISNAHSRTSSARHRAAVVLTCNRTVSPGANHIHMPARRLDPALWARRAHLPESFTHIWSRLFHRRFCEAAEPFRC